MKSTVICLVAVGLFLIGSVAGAQTLVTYDNFEGKTLNPEKWTGIGSTDSGMATLELTRLIKNDAVLNSKALNLSNRTYVNESISGTSSAHNGIVFVDGSGINTIEATVLVKKIQLPVCISRDDIQPFDTFVRLRIGGTFFNTGGAPNSYLNDVFAWIGVGLATPGDNTLHAYARAMRCDDSNCNTTTSIGGDDPVDLGTVTLNKRVKLRITCDLDRDQFIFQNGKTPPVAISYSGYSDVLPPNASNGGMKRLQIQNILPNCTDEPRLFGYIDASFDNIKVNEPDL